MNIMGVIFLWGEIVSQVDHIDEKMVYNLMLLFQYLQFFHVVGRCLLLFKVIYIIFFSKSIEN